MASARLTAMYVAGLLVCGSLNTITMKVAFTMSSTGVSGQEKLFQKPWLITFIMFVAMSFALLFDKSMMRCEMCRGSRDRGKEPLIVPDTPDGDAPGGGRTWLQKVLLVAFPSCFDIVATGLCSMGFLYLPASIWQLLRGAEMVFAAILSVTFLKRKLLTYHWAGLCLCTIGIVLVGFASVGGENSKASKSDDGSGGDLGLLFTGMAFALAGQVVQAAQVIAEEWLLTDIDLPGMQIVGFEGVWGMLIFFVAGFPLLYCLPGNDSGHVEDEVDSFRMLMANSSLLVLIAIYTLSCATYNMAGIAVTGALSAVHRVMLEALRTSIVWAFGLTVHYVFDPASKFGETWTVYSFLEVGGFVLLVVGQAIYGAMVMLPGVRYPSPVQKTIASPGSVKNFTDLPPAEYEMVMQS
mmetsp:Transcript_75631/g.213798  ORF Transcript_75631/g.213798 Transcript_75631/m.213798 type:complete len:409 (+) Transcript_75631:83-1309(+)